MTMVSTPSARSRAPRAIPPCPPPTTTTSGCREYPSSSASRSRASSHVSRSGFAPCSAPRGRLSPAVLLVALQLVERGQQRPRLALAQADVPGPPADRGLEGQPRLVDPVGARRLAGHREVRRVDPVEHRVQQVGDLVGALDRLDVPGERDQVPPVALVGEQRHRGLDVAGRQRVLEGGHPLLDAGLHVAPGAVQCLGHGAPLPRSSGPWRVPRVSVTTVTPARARGKGCSGVATRPRPGVRDHTRRRVHSRS